MKTLQIEQTHSGQFRYRIIREFEETPNTRLILVDWEFGPFNRDETIEQAKERFSFDSIQTL